MSTSQETHEVTIKRLVPTQGTGGGQIRNYTTAARGGLPTKAKCRAIIMSPKEMLAYGSRGDVEGWKFLFFGGDPQITLNDRIEFDFVKDQSETVKVLVPSHARSANARFWRVFGEQDTTET